MYTEFAVIVGILAVNLPYVVLTLQSVIEGIDRAVEDAAFSLGAGPFTMARRVLLPLALPGFAAGAIFCFILTMNAYATPVLLGGPQFVMMGPLVYMQFAAKSNWPFGAAVSFILMTATLVLTAAANLMVQRRYRNADVHVLLEAEASLQQSLLETRSSGDASARTAAAASSPSPAARPTR